MSVRKHLLSTSALKHRGVTIIFNHDHDFSERDSEFGLSRLSFSLTHHCEWNPTSQSDGEVHGNDGAKRHEAQEASPGDRRAIADADQVGQLDISGEAKTARTLRTLEPPTDAARMAHNATHVPFRDWRPFCVASRRR